jgi:2-polyprenyl-3-methyl-5-hydroxy-6-metoxy-1,4-benzoquinol methylase
MAHQHFLEAFAKAHRINTVDALLTEHSQRYSFQINSRERAQKMIRLLSNSVHIDFKGKRILDVGCAYGSFAIELAKCGANVVGIDISDKWLSLAAENARDEVNVRFLNCDASAFRMRAQLKEFAPFDIIVVNDVFEHIYDTSSVLFNLRSLTKEGALLYFKIPNGMATRAVLLEGHKKVFGVALLAPDYWSHFMDTPFHIYYRRWDHYCSLFTHFGFSLAEIFNRRTDADIELTRQHIRNDLARIRRSLKRANYPKMEQYIFLRRAYALYAEEAEADIASLPWDELYFKYRVTFWDGLLRREASELPVSPILLAAAAASGEE